jgi:hypothetical protein
MSKIRYETKSFSDAGLAVVSAADTICAQYAADGYRLTLRQLYYRFIATNSFPDSRYFTDGKADAGNTSGRGTKNCQQNYKWLGSLVADGRVSGLINWSHIEDRGRESAGGDGGYGSPERAIRAMADWYSITHWNGQPEHVEVWVEKDALTDVIARASDPLNVSYTACKGSPSHSLVHEAALRMKRHELAGRETRILYLGDHDPTGIDIPRDIQERLSLFRSDCKVERIALTMDQVEIYDPPPNYAKETDSRFQGYVDEFGTDCWELDALEPQVLVDLVDSQIREHLDLSMYRARERQEERERVILRAVSDNWDSVESYLRDELNVVGEPEEDEDPDDDTL